MIPLGDDRARGTMPLVTVLLIAANLTVFAAEITSGDPSGFIDRFAAVPYDITHGIVLSPPAPPSALLTILTAMFVHAGVAHVGFNMLFLFAFGPAVEALCGHLRFAAFYLICGIVGELAQVAVAPGSHIPSVGASGAIAGVLGGYIVSFPTASVRTVIPIGCFPLLLRLPALLVIGLWALAQFAAGFGQLSAHDAGQDGGTAYFVHIGGFACGAITIGLFGAGIRAARP